MSEAKLEEFVNNTGATVRIKLLDHKEKLGFKWGMVEDGEKIKLPEAHGKAYGFKSTKKKPKEKAVPKKKEQKPANTKDVKKEYQKKLTKVKGIGPKTARDIAQAFPTEEHLMYAIKKGSRLPIRDDLEKNLVEAFKPKKEQKGNKK